MAVRRAWGPLRQGAGGCGHQPLFGLRRAQLPAGIHPLGLWLVPPPEPRGSLSPEAKGCSRCLS